MIWDLLASSPEEAQDLRQRAALLRALLGVVNGWGVTRREAAARLQVSPQRVGDLLKGKVNLFSLNELVHMAACANLPIAAQIQA